jgi:hypothetical protein
VAAEGGHLDRGRWVLGAANADRRDPRTSVCRKIRAPRFFLLHTAAATTRANGFRVVRIVVRLPIAIHREFGSYSTNASSTKLLIFTRSTSMHLA